MHGNTRVSLRKSRKERKATQTNNTHSVHVHVHCTYIHVSVNCTSHDHMLMLDGEAFDVLSAVGLHLYVQNKEMFAYVVHVHVHV